MVGCVKQERNNLPLQSPSSKRGLFDPLKSEINSTKKLFHPVEMKKVRSGRPWLRFPAIRSKPRRLFRFRDRVEFEFLCLLWVPRSTALTNLSLR